jgi:predicted Zn-dependent peptidase
MSLPFRQRDLSNGLTIIAEPDPEAHSAAVGFFVRTGARDEDRAVMGVSHFLEHMMFKGSARRSAADVDLDFDSIGADHNAYTTGELTAFWAHVLPEHLARAAEILADILRPSLRQEDFDDEKSVILEEIAMYEDQPFWVLYERVMEEYYGDSPLGHRVLGTRESIGGLERRRMVEYFRSRYSADNTTVALAGRVDFDAACELIERDCGAWEATGAIRSYPPLRLRERRFDIGSSSVTRHYAIMVAPAPSVQDERRYAAAILAQILGAPVGSRLYWALIETGLAEEAEAQYEPRDQAGELLVHVTCDAADAARVESIVAQQIDELPATLQEDDLLRVRSKLATSTTLHGELPAGRMHRIGRMWATTRGYRSLEQELARVGAVTLDDLRALCRDFPARPVVVGRLSPADAVRRDG